MFRESRISFATILGLGLFLVSTTQSHLSAGRPFIRGDVDANGQVEMTDAIQIFGFLFLGNPDALECGDRADSDDNGTLELTDGVRILLALFQTTEPLPRPGSVCFPGQLSIRATCSESMTVHPDYDPTPDDPFTCGDAKIVGESWGRPVAVHEPLGQDPAAPKPLVLFLHGFDTSPCEEQTASFDAGAWTESIRNFRMLADARGFLYAHPNAKILTVSQDENVTCLNPWNATDACCAIIFEDADDDSRYLKDVIDEIKDEFAVDEKQVYIIGRSNGGFMAHRMACDHSETIAAIVSIAGATYLDPALCDAESPVHVLQIHGTADDQILYEGGRVRSWAPPYPGAERTVELWAEKNGCSLVSEEGVRLDFEVDIDGPDGDPAETIVTRFTSGCNAGGSAELWTAPGVGHHPGMLSPPGVFPQVGNPIFSEAVIDWLLAHPKP